MDPAVPIILVSCLGLALIIFSVGITFLFVSKAFRGGGRKSKSQEAQETKIIQEIHHGLMKMEDRIEALETLFLDDDRQKRQTFDRELRKES